MWRVPDALIAGRTYYCCPRVPQDGAAAADCDSLFPMSQVPTIVTRLTTHLLQHHYAFLQTCHDTTHSDFDIFQNQQPLVRLTLRSTETPEASSGAAVLASSPPWQQTLSASFNISCRPSRP